MSSVITSCPAWGARNRVPIAASGRPRCARCHASLPWLVDVGGDQFAPAVESPVLAIVDLWADWCGPCRVLAPVLERLASEFAGSLKVVKVDVDRSPAVAQRFRATSIPMLLFMRHGELLDDVVGAHPNTCCADASSSSSDGGWFPSPSTVCRSGAIRSSATSTS